MITMYEQIMPLWLEIALIVVSIIGFFVLGMFARRIWVTLLSYSIVLFAFFMLLYGFNHIVGTKVEFNNPVVAEQFKNTHSVAYSLSGSGSRGAEHRENYLKERIMKAAELDSVKISEYSYETLAKGDFLNFYAIKDDKQVDGTVYYTKDKMVILLSPEEEDEQKIEVSVTK